MERSGLLQLAGKDATVIGPDLTVGQQAPEFTAQAQDWSFVRPLEMTQGKVRIIASMPGYLTHRTQLRAGSQGKLILVQRFQGLDGYLLIGAPAIDEL